MNLPLPRLNRPRVEGDRQQEILTATVEILAEVGYDRLTMDAVSSRAKVSKATLYRHWENKATLVVDALADVKGDDHNMPDTGTLRGDLIGQFCGHGGLDDTHTTDVFAAVLTAICRDQEFGEAFRERFLAPKLADALEIWERAEERGELRAGLDLDLMAQALPGIVLHRTFLNGEAPTPALITEAIDQIILPAALPPGAAQPTKKPSQKKD